VTKNEHYRAMLQQCVQNQIPFKYVLNDLWFASAENELGINATADADRNSRPIQLASHNQC
jgi:hypothetical protein